MTLPITFERTLYQAVIRFKQEHPGALEARTRQRNEQRSVNHGKSLLDQRGQGHPE